MRVHLALPIVLLPLLAVGGCLWPHEREVIVYTALDREFSEPIFAEFTKRYGIHVRAKYDTESTKTVGLAEAILAEGAAPRCDLFWNNEILHTLRLERAGLLAACRPPVAEQYPAMYRAADGLWHGFAARARVLIVNTERLAEEDRPSSILALADPRWRDRCGLAKPLFGTTATHAACLFATWGDGEARQFFTAVKQNARVLAGNKRVALAVAAGQLDFGLTDTDDAIVEIEKGAPVAIVYPDQRPGEIGTLFIPNTLARIAGSPHAENARLLVEYLLSPEVEGRLAEGPSAQIPLNPHVVAKVRVATPRQVRAMEVDFAAAAQVWGEAADFLRETFARAD